MLSEGKEVKGFKGSNLRGSILEFTEIIQQLLPSQLIIIFLFLGQI